MGRPGHELLSWKQLKPDLSVYVYTGMGWKKGKVRSCYPNSCTVIWGNGSTTSTTRCYDLRNIRSAE